MATTDDGILPSLQPQRCSCHLPDRRETRMQYSTTNSQNHTRRWMKLPRCGGCQSQYYSRDWLRCNPPPPPPRRPVSPQMAKREKGVHRYLFETNRTTGRQVLRIKEKHPTSIPLSLFTCLRPSLCLVIFVISIALLSVS